MCVRPCSFRRDKDQCAVSSGYVIIALRAKAVFEVGYVSVVVEMQRTIDQRYAIKFCVKLKKTFTQTQDLLKEAYGDDVLSQTQIYEWHKDGREDVEDEQRAGRPSTSSTDENVHRVREFLNIDRRASIREMSQELNLTYYTVQKIVTEELSMRKVCAKLVPKVLTGEQQKTRVQMSREVLDCVEEDEDFLDTVISGDETWCFEYLYDPETKNQSAEWHTTASPRPKKARMSKSKVKTMLIVFFDSRGIVHKEFVPPGSTVNAAFYRQVLDRLRKRIARCRPLIVGKWTLHHDNAPSHTAFVCTSYLAKHGIAVLPHPPYSPDVSPPDFFLFPLIKRNLKGRRFQSIADIQKSVTDELKVIPESAFKKCFEQWKDRYRRCIEAQGMYFEEY